MNNQVGGEGKGLRERVRGINIAGCRKKDKNTD